MPTAHSPGDTPHGGPLGALDDTIEVYQNEQGIPPANYQAAATVATTDPTWAYFTIHPTPAAKDNLQGATATPTWTVAAGRLSPSVRPAWGARPNRRSPRPSARSSPPASRAPDSIVA
ncbi:MAG: hypothetical protein ACRDIY_19345 [Chloroflexota bacterium]